MEQELAWARAVARVAAAHGLLVHCIITQIESKSQPAVLHLDIFEMAAPRDRRVKDVADGVGVVAVPCVTCLAGLGLDFRRRSSSGAGSRRVTRLQNIS
ncbi:hypothetical protein OAO87_04415 [bacterium]|nr:hypothetical protein [bacterium]